MRLQVLCYEKTALQENATDWLRANADAIVLPIRADIYGKYILQATMNGPTLIVPDKGPHQDFLGEEDATFVQSSIVPCRMGPCAQMSVCYFTCVCFTSSKPYAGTSLVQDGTWSVLGMPSDEMVTWIEMDARDLAIALQRVRLEKLHTKRATREKICQEVWITFVVYPSEHVLIIEWCAATSILGTKLRTKSPWRWIPRFLGENMDEHQRGDWGILLI
jgi:hypothetical protein